MSDLKSSESALQGEIGMRTCLLDERLSAEVQAVLVSLAPAWSNNVRIVRDERTMGGDALPFDRASALFEALEREAHRPKTPFRRMLEREFGPPSSERMSARLSLSDGSGDLWLFVDANQLPLARTGRNWRLGNSITFQLNASTVEGHPAYRLAEELVERLAQVLPIDYGFACARDEFDRKNISRERGMRAIGRDISRYLPGLYWLNYFGPVYAEFIGRDRLLTSPAEARALDDGVLVRLMLVPTHWRSAEYTRVEQHVLEHLGREHFFDREHSDRPTVAPDLGIPRDVADAPPMQVAIKDGRLTILGQATQRERQDLER